MRTARGKGDENYRIDARLALLFDMLDVERSGTVPFNDLVTHLDQFAHITYSLRREIHLILEGIGQLTLRLDHFEEVVLQMEATCPKHVDFDDIVNAITISAASPPQADKKYDDSKVVVTPTKKLASKQHGLSADVVSKHWGRNFFIQRKDI
jgi:hypothetical protein